MKFFAEVLYSKTMLVSLLIHVVLISGLVLLVPFRITELPQQSIPVTVDIVPARVIDTGNMAAEPANPSPSLPAQQSNDMQNCHRSESVSRQAERGLPLAPALSGEASDILVARPVYGEASAGQIVVSTSGGDEKEQKENGSGVDSQASCLGGPEPVYPSFAKAAGWEGTVVLRVLVDTRGSAAAVSIRVSSGHKILDDSAVKAVKKYRFLPKKKAGKPIASYYDLKVNFGIDD